MIKIENIETGGFDPSLRGMRNPMNSWEKSDSYWFTNPYEEDEMVLGPEDLKLATKLAKAGPVHAKYRRMLIVYADIVAPLYWWKEFDTYRMGVEKNSCSTMHKVMATPFTLDDFSFEHMDDEDLGDLMRDMETLNKYRNRYLKTDHGEDKKKWWWKVIQRLPSSYNQRRTVMMSYEALANMYKYRHAHKLDEWVTFCEWIETLPYSELITAEPDRSMDMDTYQALAKRTINPELNSHDMADHALKGMVGEIGELMSIYQKLYQGHEFDPEHAMKELSDLMWFITEYCTAQGWSLGDICEMNIDKLMKRYPDGFDAEKSKHRAEGDI